MNKETQQSGKAFFELFLKLLGARLFSNRQAKLFFGNFYGLGENLIEESGFTKFYLKLFNIAGQGA